MSSAAPVARPPRFRSVGGRDPLVDLVVSQIQGQILDGRLPVGAKLPPEREFAVKLKVSRTVVREAVRILVTRGLLETKHGVGTTVRAMSAHQAVQPLTLYLKTGPQPVQLQHLHQVRCLIEVENAGVAAEVASSEDVEALESLCASMNANAEDRERFAADDSAFHRRIAEITRNPVLILLLDSLQDLLREIRSRVATIPSLAARVMPTHLEICERIRERDVEGARDAMRRHLSIAYEIQQQLEQ